MAPVEPKPGDPHVEPIYFRTSELFELADVLRHMALNYQLDGARIAIHRIVSIADDMREN